MPGPKGGSAIVYGKIQIHGSPGESLAVCREQLMRILKQAGYPELDERADERDDDDEDEEEFEEALEEEREQAEDLQRRKDEDGELESPWKNIVKRDE